MDDHTEKTLDIAILDSARPVPPAGLGRRRRRRQVLPVAAVLLGLALAAAACSSGPSTPGVAGASSGTTPTTAAGGSGNQPSNSKPSDTAAQLAFSQCMRAHGVTNFPDPDSQGKLIIQGGPNSSTGLDPSSATFKAANQKCQSKLPKPTPAQQAQAYSNALKMSQCMRAHGIKDFPDPQASSGGAIKISGGGPNSSSDLNPNNPLFQAAQKICMPNAPHLPAGGGKTSTGSGGGIVSVGG
ncbi:MAG TPA: hypothetical protein VG244_04990 [Acidimicrobiales bacterium]|nr:hypothetical protein [Acidimicrobiales bacterium]